MNVARDMLIGAGFTIVSENGNMVNVEIGGNAAVLVMDDPERDPWAWRQILAQRGHVAYGKFFDRKAGFISLE